MDCSGSADWGRGTAVLGQNQRSFSWWDSRCIKGRIQKTKTHNRSVSAVRLLNHSVREWMVKLFCFPFIYKCVLFGGAGGGGGEGEGGMMFQCSSAWNTQLDHNTICLMLCHFRAWLSNLIYWWHLMVGSVLFWPLLLQVHMSWLTIFGQNSSLVVCWACCSSWCSVMGLILLWGEFFPLDWIFPLELTWLLTPFTKNSFRWEYTPRSSLCTHAFHGTDSKDPDIHILDGWMPAAKTHPACTIHEDGMWLPLWLD